MTVPATPTRKAGPSEGNGVATKWPFTFKVFVPDDIYVVRTAGGVRTTLVRDVDYTVTLNADQSALPGGTVTYPITGSPLPAGQTLLIVGNTPYSQDYKPTAGGNFNPDGVERAFDRIVMQIQQLAVLANAALRIQEGETAEPLGTPTSRANRLVGFDASGNRTLLLPQAGDAAGLAIDLLNAASASKGAGQVGYSQTLAYPAGTVGFTLSKLQIVVGTGVAATDDAAIQAAIDAAPAGGVIELVGTFASSAAKNVKPQIAIVGRGAVINHSNAATNCFQYTAGAPAGFPGQILFDGLKITGPGAPSGEALGTLTFSNIKAGIFINGNFPFVRILRADIQGFFAGVMLRDCYQSVLDGYFAYNRHGILLFGETHDAVLLNAMCDQNTMVGCGINYGGAGGIYQILKNPTFVAGAYQKSPVGIWLEGVEGAAGVGTTYFEGNTTSDMIVGVADGFSPGYKRSANFTRFQGIGTSSPCNAPQAGWPGVNISVQHSSDCDLRGLGFYGGTSTATYHITENGAGDRNQFQLAFTTLASPYSFADPSRVVLSRGGRTNFPRNMTAGLTYGAHGAASPSGRGPWFGGGFSGRDSIILEAIANATDVLLRAKAGEGQIRFSDDAGVELFSVDAVNSRVNAYRSLMFGANAFPGQSGAPATIASATTIAPTTLTTRVSGTTPIETITVASRVLNGTTIVLIPTAAWTWTAAGNIAVAGTAVVGRALHLTWDGGVNKWYPSYV